MNEEINKWKFVNVPINDHSDFDYYVNILTAYIGRPINVSFEDIEQYLKLAKFLALNKRM